LLETLGNRGKKEEKRIIIGGSHNCELQGTCKKKKKGQRSVGEKEGKEPKAKKDRRGKDLHCTKRLKRPKEGGSPSRRQKMAIHRVRRATNKGPKPIWKRSQNKAKRQIRKKKSTR